eukprot:m.69301 g.69301  ORF g.69301 m.69301 type:complete len:355 (-) comp12038_c1_seq1:55-1119(-)
MIASWGADYLWLDGCNMNRSEMESRYELWSHLLNESGREIVWEVSWPAYVAEHGNDPGNSPYNIELWYKSAWVGHEFRFYNDNAPEWTHILDIAESTHEYNMARFHRPGAYAFMDMLESGNSPLTFAESRSHFALWLIMAQPLHLGNDIRNLSTELLNMFTNPDVVRIAKDPAVLMGRRAAMNGSRLNGTQVWVRDLSDGSRLVGLLNALPIVDHCNWTERRGGYFQVDPPTPSGNLLCSNDLAQLKATCCQAGPEACASVDWQASTNNGCAKHNDKLGWVNDSSFVDYILEGGVGPVPTPTETICFNWTQIGLNPYEPTMVRNIWTQTDLGLFNTSMCLPVDYHDTVLLHLQQ